MGKVTKKILNKWNDEVGLNIQKQISSWYAKKKLAFLLIK